MSAIDEIVDYDDDEAFPQESEPAKVEVTKKFVLNDSKYS